MIQHADTVVMTDLDHCYNGTPLLKLLRVQMAS